MIFSFHNNTMAMKADMLLKKSDVVYQVIPTPRSLSASCGLSIRFDDGLVDEVSQALQEGGVTWITQN